MKLCVIIHVSKPELQTLFSLWLKNIYLLICYCYQYPTLTLWPAVLSIKIFVICSVIIQIEMKMKQSQLNPTTRPSFDTYTCMMKFNWLIRCFWLMFWWTYDIFREETHHEMIHECMVSYKISVDMELLYLTV